MILAAELPHINDAAFVASGGEPGKIGRRRHLYDTILGYRRRYDTWTGMQVADLRWRADLAYLREGAASANAT